MEMVLKEGDFVEVRQARGFPIVPACWKGPTPPDTFEQDGDAMNFKLNADDERFVTEQVIRGRFKSADDAVAEAIDRLRWEDAVEPTAEDLAAVREGLDQLNRGEGIPWEQVRRELNEKHGLSD